MSHRPATTVERWCRRRLLSVLARMQSDRLRWIDAETSTSFGGDTRGLQAEVTVRNPRAYRLALLGGPLGAGESYLRGDWECDDLVTVLRIMARNQQALSTMDRHARVLRPVRRLQNLVRGNSRRGSRRNIAAHYDLSNEFFSLMLDPTMTYSSGWFDAPDDSLYAASIAKYDRICRRLRLTPADHVLEIGCGWGGFAIHAASKYGCRVTATTISAEQFALAKPRIDQLGLGDRVNLLQRDYRDLSGAYDKLVSIEMIEAVGEKYLDRFFARCSQLLTPDGQMLLQAIIIPDERYDRYRRSVDFIQRYVFPGGFLPSFSAIGQSLRKVTDFRLTFQQDFGLHYAETLARWRENFWRNIHRVRELGFDERFVRTWHYYLCYCEAGFRERQIGVSHIQLDKPNAGSGREVD